MESNNNRKFLNIPIENESLGYHLKMYLCLDFKLLHTYNHFNSILNLGKKKAINKLNQSHLIK